MKNNRWTCCVAIVLAWLGLLAIPADAQAESDAISDSEIAALATKLASASKSVSSARKKLSLKRVIREGDALLEKNRTAPNRFEILGVLFRGQKQLVNLEDSPANRKAFLKTCEQLAAAPNKYAAIRLDADLLLSQLKSAKQDADLQTRAGALIPLVDRYQDTAVETKVIRIAMLMALEFGDTRVIARLRQVLAERCPGDLEMINFQRDNLAGQVFGAPFVGRLEQADGKTVRFPLDTLGTTTGLYFWSKEDGGLEDLKELAEAWKKKKDEGEGRYRFLSVNLDDLPDAGKSVLQEHGLNWPALKLPGGRKHPIFKTYTRWDPKIITTSPTGYAAIFMSGGRRSRGYDRNLQSMLARSWAESRYTSQVQSFFAGEFLVVDAVDKFDPASPPEYKAFASNASGKGKLPRAAGSVPEDKLRAIQSCFVKPPLRYRLRFDEARAAYEKAEQLCRDTIQAHSDAPDLWIVRNRRIVALMGLWKVTGERKHFDAAAAEAQSTLDGGYSAGTDIIARFCLARQALRPADADPKVVIDTFVNATGSKVAPAPALAAASLLALDVGERRLHEHYRRAFLDQHANDPVMWTATAYLLNRYQRYWMYHPPFVAGWTYGRRQGYFLTMGTPEDANRTFRAEFKTLDGKVHRIPEEAEGKWIVIEFSASAEGNRHIERYGSFVEHRPFEDVSMFTAILDDDGSAVRKALAEKKRPNTYPTLLVPGGIDSPIARQLGIINTDRKPNILILRPDGSIAAMLSGLGVSGAVIQNVIQWHDEQAVDRALARGDLDEAKRLAFAHAPIKQLPPPDAKKNWKAKPIAIPHLRSRAKVYMAMRKWEAAFEDMQAVYLQVNSKAGYISMRTDELDETEKLKAEIESALEQAKATK